MKSKMMKHEKSESASKEKMEESLYKASPKMAKQTTHVKAISGVVQPKVKK